MSDVIPPMTSKVLTDLEEFQLEVLPVLRLAEFALREPDNQALRSEARTQLTALLEHMRLQMRLMPSPISTPTEQA